MSQQATAQKTVLVTGASSGIGYATAQTLARVGHTVYASARKVEALKPLEALGCRPLQLDVTLERSRVDAVRHIETQHGAVDILVNNAGYGLSGVVEELELEAMHRQFETNVFGLVRLSQLVLPAMRAKGWGRIVNVGSVGGSFTAPGAGAYHASKYAVEAFSDALRMETRGFGVGVALIKPTGVQTPFAVTLERSAPLPDPDSPYRAFAENSARVTRELFGKNARIAGIIAPEQVARAILSATQDRVPRSRYVVGLSGHVYLTLRRMLSDRAWDALMASQFPMNPRAGRVDRSDGSKV